MTAIRPIREGDRADWAGLWRGYLDFYGTALPDEIYEAQWARLMAGGNVRGCLAEAEGRPVGLVHYIFHDHGWKMRPVCYLQDLYVDEAARGTGLGRALIEAVYRAADAADAPDVYWLTQTGNAKARRLYDRMATLTDFVKYARR